MVGRRAAARVSRLDLRVVAARARHLCSSAGGGAGAADVALGGGAPFAKEELDEIAVRSPNQLRLGTTLSTNYFFLNTRVPPFDDVRVRRAVNIAFDREPFARMLGLSFAPTCQILPPNLPGYRPTCPYSTDRAARFDVARRLVRSSGTSGARVIVRVPTPIADQGQYMASVLDSLGYKARVVLVSPDSYFDVVSDSRNEAQTGYWGWVAGFPSAADFIPPQFSCAAYVPASPGENTNVSGFCDQSIDVQMRDAAAAQVQDPAAATTLWQKVDQALLAQAPVVPVYNRSNVDIVSKRVGNYQYNPQWGVLLGQLWVK
jgi:peptide/nickel transport system substrate-binding protein